MIHDLATLLIGTLVRLPPERGGYLALVIDTGDGDVKVNRIGLSTASDPIWLPIAELEYITHP